MLLCRFATSLTVMHAQVFGTQALHCLCVIQENPMKNKRCWCIAFNQLRTRAWEVQC